MSFIPENPDDDTAKRMEDFFKIPAGEENEPGGKRPEPVQQQWELPRVPLISGRRRKKWYQQSWFVIGVLILALVLFVTALLLAFNGKPPMNTPEPMRPPIQDVIVSPKTSTAATSAQTTVAGVLTPEASCKIQYLTSRSDSVQVVIKNRVVDGYKQVVTLNFTDLTTAHIVGDGLDLQLKLQGQATKGLGLNVFLGMFPSTNNVITLDVFYSADFVPGLLPDTQQCADFYSSLKENDVFIVAANAATATSAITPTASVSIPTPTPTPKLTCDSGSNIPLAAGSEIIVRLYGGDNHLREYKGVLKTVSSPTLIFDIPTGIEENQGLHGLLFVLSEDKKSYSTTLLNGMNIIIQINDKGQPIASDCASQPSKTTGYILALGK